MTQEVLLKPKVSLIKRIMASLSDLEQCEEIELHDAYKLTDRKVRIPVKDYPLQLFLPPHGRILHLYPENLLANPKQPSGSFLLFDPQRFFSDLSGFIRLEEGEEIVIGEGSACERTLIEPGTVDENCRLRIRIKDGGLVFKNLSRQTGACISPLVKKKQINNLLIQRRRKLRRIRKLLGGKIRPLDKDQALEQIQRINALMEQEAWRPLADDGRPGGVVELPEHLPPIIVGDLHAKVDNLLAVLSQSGFLDALEEGRASLLLLGDAVHCEEKGRYDKMGGSLLIMDLIFALKLHFPDRVFYLRGNHDSFSEEIGKGGVPQGLLWEKKLHQQRGPEYVAEMQRFYDQLPYVAHNRHFIACHAAAPVSNPNRNALINIRSHPKLVRELTSNRIYQPHRPGGYTKGDVRRLRKALGVAETTAFIVGHTPITPDDTLWENVGSIHNHFVLYSADSRWIGAAVLLGDRIYPQLFPVEPISTLINRMH